MTKFEVQMVNDLDLRIVRIVDPVVYEDYVKLAEEELDQAPAQNFIWDISFGSLQLLSVDDMKRIMALRPNTYVDRAGGHTVFVVHDAQEHTLLKWYATVVGGLPSQYVTFHVAESLDEAIQLIRDNSRKDEGSGAQIS